MWDGAEDGSGFMYGDVAQDVNAPGWYIRLLQDPAFTDELRCRYENLRQNILSENFIHQKIDSVANVVSESQNWHYLTWGHLGAATGTPEIGSPSQTYAEEVQRLKDWYDRRLAWLDQNMPGTVNGCHFAGSDEISLKSSFEIGPNPFKNNITIQSEEKILMIKLFDQSGREIASETSGSGNKISIKTSEELSSGIYFLHLETTDGTSAHKIIRQ